MIGLLLALVAIGLVAWFMLKGSKTGSGGTDTGNAVNCEQRISKIVSATGGVGPQAQAAYDALPSECRKLMPNPSALAPSPQKMPDDAQ
jgi:hypothetical protein